MHQNQQKLIECIIISLFFLSPLISHGQTAFFVDFHHQGLHQHIYSQDVRQLNPWEAVEHDCSGNFDRKLISKFEDYPKSSQADLSSLAEGDVRLSCLAITPMEDERIKPKKMDVKSEGQKSHACIHGVFVTKEFVLRKERDYFQSVFDHIRYLEEFENKAHYIDGKPYFFEVVRDGNDIFNLQKNENKLGLVLSVQGGHSLGKSIYIKDPLLLESEEYRKVVLENIERLKGIIPLINGYDEKIKYPILYFGPAHHFENGLCGNYSGLDPVEAQLYEGRSGQGGMTSLGKTVIEKLLDAQNGYRILIDVAHMNVPSRQWYYEYLEAQRVLGDTIPVIASHVGISGLGWEHSLYTENMKLQGGSSLNHQPINLSREDIEAIQASKGLVGISLDKSLISGNKAREEERFIVKGSAQSREFATKILLANIFQVVKTINQPDAWDRICIGSDFDALGQSLPVYSEARQMPDLNTDIVSFLQNPQHIFGLFDPEEIKKLMFDYSPAEISKKILSSNATGFIQMHLGKTSGEKLAQGK